jgi:predicted DNA-binding transcriptional regulator AlpA
MSSTESSIIERLDSLTAAVTMMARLSGSRLTRQEVCQRLGVHRNTLAAYMTEKDFPKPGLDGKWLLSEVLEWEARK